jgi:hypothetical protein
MNWNCSCDPRVKLNWNASNMKKIEHESIEFDPRSDFTTTSSGGFFTERTPFYPALVIYDTQQDPLSYGFSHVELGDVPPYI